jgi:hypothetical protein
MALPTAQQLVSAYKASGPLSAAQITGAAPVSGGVAPTVNPHDAPGYNPKTDPTSTAYNPNYQQIVTPGTTATAGTAQDIAQKTLAQNVPSTILEGQTTAQTPTMATPEQVKTVENAKKTIEGIAQQQKAVFEAKKTAQYDTGGEAGRAITETAAGLPTPPSSAAAPTLSPEYTQFGDQLVDARINEVNNAKNEAIDAGAMAAHIKALGENEINQLDYSMMNFKNMMDGTDDTIRQEIIKSGGTASESQVQGIANARNKDLIKQYNAMTTQRAMLASDLSMRLELANADITTANAKYDAAVQRYDMEQKIQTNTDTKLNKIITDYGPQQFYEMFKDNPQMLQLAGDHLYGDSTAFLDPQRVASMQTYKDKNLAMGQQRIEISMQGQSNLMDYRQGMEAQRYTSAGNNIIKNYLSLPAYKIYSNASPYLARIEAAGSVPGSVSDNELLDSVIKLNTGGGQITEAQVATITGGRSFADTVNVFSNKFKKGGVLSTDQRKQLTDLAHAVYTQYQKQYTPIRDAMYKAFDTSQIPEQYRDMIPDLNSLSQVGGAAATYSTNSNTATVKGKQYYMASDGIYYPVTQ